MTRRGKTCFRRTIAGITGICLAIAPGALIPIRPVLAQESPQTEDDEADGDGVGDWILRLFRGSDDSSDEPDGNRKRGTDGGSKAGGGGGNSGGGNSGGGGSGGGDDNGGDDNGGDDGGGDDGGGDDGGEGGEGGEGGDDD